MTRHLRPILCVCLLAALCSFLQPFCNLAYGESGKDWVKGWMTKEKQAFRTARDQEAANYYSKAIEIGNYYSKAIEADSNLFVKREEWVIQRLKSGKPADFLEKVDVKLADASLPLRKDLIEKYYKELIITASFLEQLIRAVEDFKTYPKGITIKNAIIVGNLDLTNAEVPRWLEITKCIFMGKIDLGDSFFQRGLNLAESHFLDKADFYSLKVGGRAIFDKALFRGPVDFGLADIASAFEASGTRFESTAGFDSLKVGSSAFFKKAVFRRGVNFVSANVSSNFEAEESRYESAEEDSNFHSLKVGGHAILQNAVFRGPVKFDSANIASHFFAQRARFENPDSAANFTSMKVGHSAHFGETTFRGPALFLTASIKGQFAAHGARFVGKESQAVFNGLTVGSDAFFTNAVFRGPVDFVGATIASYFVAKEARFESTESTVSFNALTVRGLATFDNAVFRGPVNFGSSNFAFRFDANNTVFCGPVDLDLATIGSYFVAKEAQFENTANFTCLRVGAAFFTNAVFQGSVGIGGADIGDLHLEGAKFQEAKEITLEGMTYKNIYTEKRDFKEAVEMLNHMKRYHPQPYKQLESYLAGLGYKELADAVFVEGKRRERRETWNWLSWEFPTNVLKFIFLEKAVGYGRYVNRVVWYVIIFIALGTAIFSSPKIFKDERKLSLSSACWYSLGLFLPFVTLDVVKFHVIDKGAYFSLENLLPDRSANPRPCWFIMRLQFPVEIYYYIHQLAGYIILSIGIVAFSGIIK